jgi:hypothetical protein
MPVRETANFGEKFNYFRDAVNNVAMLVKKMQKWGRALHEIGFMLL